MDIGLPQFQDYMAKMCTSHTSIRDIGLPKFKTSPLRLRSTLKWRKEKEQNLWKEIYKKEDRNNNRIILVYVHIGDETLILSYFLRYFLWKWEHTILYPMLQQAPYLTPGTKVVYPWLHPFSLVRMYHIVCIYWGAHFPVESRSTGFPPNTLPASTFSRFTISVGEFY